MTHKRKYFFYFICLIFICCSAYAFDKETEKIMPFISSKSLCYECHKDKNAKLKLFDPATACEYLCKKCHKNMDRHHKVGLRLKGKLSSNFKLTEKNKMSCFTCHDLGVKRFSNSSWRAQSLFEKMFRNKSQYKTFYLVMKNNEGQLCKKCH